MLSDRTSGAREVRKGAGDERVREPVDGRRSHCGTEGTSRPAEDPDPGGAGGPDPAIAEGNSLACEIATGRRLRAPSPAARRCVRRQGHDCPRPADGRLLTMVSVMS